MTWMNWPLAVLIFALAAIGMFRLPLTRLLDRIRKVGISKSGVEADAQPNELQPPAQTPASEELRRLFDNAMLLKREEEIRSDLQRLAFKEPTEREGFLIRLLAAASIVQAFEQVYRAIWGSQLAVLQFLNSAGAEGVASNLLQPWYDQAAVRHPEAYGSYSFDRWLGYLRGQNLIVDAPGGVAISLEGREFLKYVLHQGYPIYKAG